MLYVPLFFCIFDRLAERSEKKKNGSAPEKLSSETPPGENSPGGRTPDKEGG
jgi:hypothetical protein